MWLKTRFHWQHPTALYSIASCLCYFHVYCDIIQIYWAIVMVILSFIHIIYASVQFFLPASCPPLLILFSSALQHRARLFKSLALGQNVSDISLCKFRRLSVSLLQHMLSPQKAPERLLQLADSNLGSLVVEMDQLHSRVQTLLFFLTAWLKSLSLSGFPSLLSGLFLCLSLK